MKHFVTGAAGFIGSSLVDRLLGHGETVVGYDNFSTGDHRFIDRAKANPAFTMIRGDVLDESRLGTAMRGVDFVWHLAANADVRFGVDHPRKDLEQNTIATYNVLETMRSNGIGKVAFASTGSIYGEAALIPTPEDAPFPIQTSLYGASKLACEGLIAAYCEGFGLQGFIFRFVSVVGERYIHGHIFDFFRMLTADPGTLRVLGDGHQRKSYIHVEDCIDGMLTAVAKANGKINVLNLGTDEYIELNESIRIICHHLGVAPKLIYSGGERGWVGDNPFIFLDTKRIRALGWRPKLTIAEGVVRTLDWLRANRWVYEVRA
jgi:UDP-glucose 4-epimerase